MKNRFNSRLAAGGIAVLMHVIVVGGLATHRPATNPVHSAEKNNTAFQASLILPPERASGLPAAGEKGQVANSSPASGSNSEEKNTASEKSVQEMQEPGVATMEENDQPAWMQWLPQLSNSPLIKQFPFHGEPNYFPSGELQVRPAPEEPVIIPFPDAPFPKLKGTAILLVYVNAEGIVDHVEIDKSELPGEFEQAAIDTFMRTKMRPGIRDGVAVPARMKIEVEFEAK